MRKTTIYLEAELDRALDRLAAQAGTSKAEAIRSALRSATQGVERPRITAIGIAHGPGDVAQHVERHLRETGFGEP